MDIPIQIRDDSSYVTDQLITYIGNKRKLLSFIHEVLCPIQTCLGDRIAILDGFAGSGVVSRFFKRFSHVLHSNDLERYAYVIGQCHLTNQSERPHGVPEAIEYLNKMRLRDDLSLGLIEAMYAPKDDKDIQRDERAFYTNQNAKIIDNLRRTIDEFPNEMRNHLLAPLVQKASVHANTSGVFKGFYKNTETKTGQFGGNGQNALPRITGEIVLENPILSCYECEWHMHQRDTNELVKDIEVDVAYFDPPYNQHPYGSNYFMLNLIIDYVAPQDVSKVSGIPTIWNKSDYNKRNEAEVSMNALIRDTKAKYILVSYNDEGIIPFDELMIIFNKHGKVVSHKKKYTTFRGSRNLSGRSKSVKEYIFSIEKK